MKRYVKLILMALSAVILLAVAEPARASSDGKVIIAVERFSLGQGYLIEPEHVTYYAGESYARVLDRTLKRHGYDYTHDGTLVSGFYLQSIKNADAGRLNIPACIRNMETINGIAPPDNTAQNANFPDLSEFSYCQQSGWYFFVNNAAPNVGFDNVIPQSGDVVRVQFTLYGYGADLGAFSSGGHTALNHPNRDAVTRKLVAVKEHGGYQFEQSLQTAYKEAADIVADLDSSESDIARAEDILDKALEGLNNPTPSPSPSPEPSPSPSPEPSPSPNPSPEPSPNPSPEPSPSPLPEPSPSPSPEPSPLPELSPSPEPSPSPLPEPSPSPSPSPGSSPEPVKVTGISLKSKLGLKVGDAYKLAAKVEPANAADKSVSWKTSDSSIVQVGPDGKVTAEKVGAAVITAQAGNFKAACKITVTAQEKTIQGTVYSLTSKNEAAIKKTKSKAKVAIPGAVKIGNKTYKVTAIQPNAFKNNKQLKSVTVGSNIKTIGTGAFSGCKNLTKISIKTTALKKVGKNAFKGISKKAVIKTPAKKLKEYKKLLKGKGQAKTVKIQK